MKYYTLAAVILLSLFPSDRLFAQAEAKIGYYVTNTGDTLKRRIRYKPNMTTASSIYVSASSNGKFEELNMEDVKAFGYQGFESFERHATLIDISSTSIEDVFSDYKYEVQVDTVLLQVLVKGPINLFCYTNSSNGDQYFIQEGNAPLIPLTNRLYIKEGTTVMESRKYIQTLKKSLTCKSINSVDFENIKYDRPEIATLVYKHNKCIDPKAPRPRITRAKIINHISVGGGLTLNKISYKGTFREGELSEETPFNSLGYQVHVLLESVMPIHKRPLSFTIEPTFSKYSESNFDNSPPTSKSLSINITTIQIPVGFRYIPISKPNYRAYISGGINSIIKSNSIIGLSVGVFDQPHFDFNGFAGAGIISHRLRGEIRLHTKGLAPLFERFAPITWFELHHSYTELLLSYQLF